MFFPFLPPGLRTSDRISPGFFRAGDFRGRLYRYAHVLDRSRVLAACADCVARRRFGVSPFGREFRNT